MPTCLKCSAEFPNHLMLSGKKRNLSKRKFCLQCSPFGKNNRSDLRKFENGKRKCGKCAKLLRNEEFYPLSRGGTSAWCKACFRSYYKENRHEVKRQLVALKGGCCEVCGYSKCLDALDFHHRDSGEKDLKVSSYRTKTPSARLLQEVRKCTLLCSNCHREVHAEIAGPIPAPATTGP